MGPLESLGAVSYSHSIATKAVSVCSRFVVRHNYTNVTGRHRMHDGIGRESRCIARQKQLIFAGVTVFLLVSIQLD